MRVEMYWSLILALLPSAVWPATLFDCPNDWVTYGYTCYKFIFEKVKFDAARENCALLGASLISVNERDENDFINQWLIQNDFYRNQWYTSGTKNSLTDNTYSWAGANSNIKIDQQFWILNFQNDQGDIIVYKFDGSNYGWSRTYSTTLLPYICEISQSEAYRLTQDDRGFDYGMGWMDSAYFERGPAFTKLPESALVVSQSLQAMLECRATGNPLPTFKWYFGENPLNLKEVVADQDKRYTITSGKITISNPQESKDAGTYRCSAENKFGKIMSNPVKLTFGYLDEFSNVKDAPVVSDSYEGAVIQCSKINFKPALVYNWMRNATNRYIYPTITPYIFISSNGKLYFSEVTGHDMDDYFCQVTLTGLSSTDMGSIQAPSKMSREIGLIVRDSVAKRSWGPVIQDDFIAVFPNPPLKGQDIRLECFAYGSADNYEAMWKYSWAREVNPMPETAVISDFNRVLTIYNARLEDQGVYHCYVKRGSAGDSKSYTLQLEAAPYFIVPLRDQHVDKGSQLTWRCEAKAYPKPVYSWYKNGEPLTSSGDITVTGNQVVILNLDPKLHDGMYQCSASNDHGTMLSAAQLRVLYFKPNFLKYPLDVRMVGALNGNLTILCKPEAAPKAVIMWKKNNANLNLNVGQIGGRIRMLANGNLFMTNLNYGDAGVYTCLASNELGKSESHTTLAVKTQVSMVRRPPLVTTHLVNNTAFLPCQASYDPHLDLIYIWRLNGNDIDLEDDPFYKKEVSPEISGLYVRQPQFKHEGVYQCVAKTTLGEVTAEGKLIVQGPPGEPSGVFGKAGSVTSHSIRIYWFPGTDHGRSVDFYTVEAEMEYDMGKWVLKSGSIPDQRTKIDGNTRDMRTYVVEGLKPGNGYRFRVTAVNELGYSVPSQPSGWYQTRSEAPVVAPSNVRGGGGKEGDLTMVWDILPKVDHGGTGLGYIVYWRQYKENVLEGKWEYKRYDDWKRDSHVALVGLENYYLQYQVKVQALNDYGRGPNSSISLVYSAEGMPIGVPASLYCDAYNSTAMIVTWVAVPDTREVMKGRVRGYQVNYWHSEDVEPLYKRYIRFDGQLDEVVVIGLSENANWWFEVQVFNTAGLGPLSQLFIQETLHMEPQLYPQEVKVHSYGSDSVRLTWRGISTSVAESVITGYKIYLWPANEHYRTAKIIETEKFETDFVVNGIEGGKVYAVRVAGFSDGGRGKKSPTVYFTLGGHQIQIDSTVSEIRAGAKGLTYSFITLFISILVLIIS